MMLHSPAIFTAYSRAIARHSKAVVTLRACVAAKQDCAASLWRGLVKEWAAAARMYRALLNPAPRTPEEREAARLGLSVPDYRAYGADLEEFAREGARAQGMRDFERRELTFEKEPPQ